MTSFEDELRTALPSAAEQRPTTGADWARFTAKLSAQDHNERPGLRAASRRWRRWRMPLSAAAAVALVALGVVAVTSGGSGRNHTAGPAAPGSGQQSQLPTSNGSNASAAGRTVDGLAFAHHPDHGEYARGLHESLLDGVVTDTGGCLTMTSPDGTGAPVVPSFSVPAMDPVSLKVGDSIALSGGFADAAELDKDFGIPDECRAVAAASDGYFVAWQLDVVGDAGNVKSGRDVVVDTSTSGTARQTFVMRLVGKPAVLQVASPFTDAELAESVTSDGTPLGYVTVVPSRAETPGTMDSGGSYIYGVVSSEIDRVAIQTSPAKDSGWLPGRFADPGAVNGLWIVTDHDTSTGEATAARLTWTEMDDGWRAFAIQVSDPSPVFTVFGYTADRELVQARQFSPDGTAVVDLPADDAPAIAVWGPDVPAPRFDAAGPNGAAGPFVATYPDVPGMPATAALFEGTLAVHDGCLVAVPSLGDSTAPVTLVFPQSQVEPATAPVILHFRGTDYAEGDAISVGGSMRSAPPADLPKACPAQAWGVSPYE